jgi:hypothetical protein
MEGDPTEREVSEPRSSVQGGASTFDYFAAGMITNFFVWLWNSALVSLPLLSVLDAYSVTVISYMVYILGSVVGCNLLILKAKGDASKTCLKGALVSWAISIPLLLRSSTELYLGLIVSLLFCFLMGGIIASFLNLKRLRG